MTTSPDGPVVLLGTAEDEPLTGRIAAELRALGIAIEIRVVAGDARGIEVEVESALREGARAAVRIDAQTGRTEVSIPDPGTRQVALKQVLEGPPTAALVPLLAVRTVEFVRATLLGPRNEEVRRTAGDASSPDAEIADGSGAEPGGERRMGALAGLGLGLDSGAVFTPGGLSSQIMMGIVARVRLSPSIGAEVMGFTPLTSGRIDEGQLSVRGSTWLAGAGLFVRQPLASRVALELGAGGLVAVVTTGGSVSPGVADIAGDASKPTLGVSAYGRLGADLSLSRNLALRLDLLGGGTFRRAVVVVGDPAMPESVRRAAWPRSYAAVLGGVEARWF